MSPVRDVNEGKIVGKISPPTSVPNNQNSPDVVDLINKARNQKIVEKVVANEFGGGQGESIGTTIVTKALDNLNKAEERYQHEVDKSRDEARAAMSELEKAKGDVMKLQMESMGNMIARLEKAQADLRAGAGNPKSLSEMVKEARELVSVFAEAARPATPPAATTTHDGTMEITLLKMKQDHELAMKNIELQMQKMTNDLNIRLQEISDTRKYKELEYNDKRNMQERGINAVQDLASAAIAGFGQVEGGEEIAVQPKKPIGQPANHPPVTNPPVAAKPPAEEPNYEVALTSFPCQYCAVNGQETEIAIPQGGGQVVCQKCGAKYEIKGL